MAKKRWLIERGKVDLVPATHILRSDEQRVVQAVLDGLIVKHRTLQLAELHTCQQDIAALHTTPPGPIFFTDYFWMAIK